MTACPSSGVSGLGREVRRIALARALVDTETPRLGNAIDRRSAYSAAGFLPVGRDPVTDADDQDALKRELLRRSLFPSRLGAAA